MQIANLGSVYLAQAAIDGGALVLLPDNVPTRDRTDVSTTLRPAAKLTQAPAANGLALAMPAVVRDSDARPRLQRVAHLDVTNYRMQDVDSVEKIRAIGEADASALSYSMPMQGIERLPEVQEWAVEKNSRVFMYLSRAARQRLVAPMLERVPAIAFEKSFDDLDVDPALLEAALRKAVKGSETTRARLGYLATSPRMRDMVLRFRPSALGYLTKYHSKTLPPAPDATNLRQRAEALHLPVINQRLEAPLLIDRILKEREANRPDHRPLAVIITATADWNSAFESDNIPIADLTGAYRVMYYEVSTRADALRALNEATAQQKASVLVLAGHGTQASMAFDRGGIEAGTLGLQHADELRQAGFGAALLPGARIVLDSCSTGSGGAAGNNIANMLGDLAPQAAVDAPTIPTNIWNIGLTEGGKLDDVNYSRRGAGYHREPRIVSGR